MTSAASLPTATADRSIRFRLVLPVTRLGVGVFSFDPIEQLVGAPIVDLLEPLMTGPVERRPSAAGAGVDVFPLALPKGEALRLPKAQELQPVELTLGALAEYVDLAARKRPELKMQYERIGLQEANVGRYWAAFFPAFFLGASFTVAVTAPGRSETETAGTVFENINLDSTTVGGGAAIGLKLTLDYPQKVARYRKATFELERARAELDVRKAKLRVELEQYWRETRAQQEMLRYQRRAMKAARSLLVLQVQEYENGVVREVVVENFMNHSHLRVELDPHVNFIVGKNGSGKSAVVLALQAGLGCKAQASGKNTSTHKNYIKHGADSACIKIHIANGGGDPYRPDDFGETVVVEHRIEKVRSCPWRPHTRCRSRSRRGAHG